MESRYQPAGYGSCGTLAGDLDVASAAHLRDHLTTLLGHGADHLILDFAHVEFVDSTGLSVLAGIHRLLQPSRQAAPDDHRTDHAAALAVAAVNQRIRPVLRTTGFTRIIPIYPSVESAIVVQQAARRRPSR